MKLFPHQPEHLKWLKLVVELCLSSSKVSFAYSSANCPCIARVSRYRPRLFCGCPSPGPATAQGDVVMRGRLIAIIMASIVLIGLALAGCSFLAPVLLVMDMAGVDDKANIKYHFDKNA